MTIEVTEVVYKVVESNGNTVINTVNETAIYESTMGPQGIAGGNGNAGSAGQYFIYNLSTGDITYA